MKLRDLAYYRTGGRCQALYEPKNIDDLAQIITALHATKQRYFILGGGTNSLVMDEDWSGAVIVFSRMKSVRRDRDRLICEAGVENTAIAQAALQAGLGGASWMNRLPGQIGATVRMNARCYGGEISEIVTEVKAVLPDGSLKTYHLSDKIFKGYKDTLFMENGAIVGEVTLALRDGDVAAIAEHMRFCEEDRIAKGQFVHPTCGCVFKNNYAVGVPSGMLLDKAGAHALSSDKAALNPKHANFVFNKGATSRDILELTLKMRELVYQTYGVWMEYEMEMLGDVPTDLKIKVDEQRPQVFQESKIAPLRAVFQKKMPVSDN